MYEQKYTVRFSEVDTSGKARLDSIVSYFQDTTMSHSDSVGQGVMNLNRNHLAWLLISWQIEIVRYPEYNEVLSVRTWATSFKSVYGYRDFDLRDNCGKVIAKASSAWLLFNYETEKMVHVTPELADIYQPNGIYVFDSEPRKFYIPKEHQFIADYNVLPSDLDTNNHVNNVQYIKIATNVLGDAVLGVKRVFVRYKKAATLGDTIHVGLFNDEECNICVLYDSKDEMFAAVKFLL